MQFQSMILLKKAISLTEVLIKFRFENRTQTLKQLMIPRDMIITSVLLTDGVAEVDHVFGSILIWGELSFKELKKFLESNPLMTNVVMSLGVQLLPSTQRSRQSLIMRRQSPVTAILGHTLYLGHLEIQIFSSGR